MGVCGCVGVFWVCVGVGVGACVGVFVVCELVCIPTYMHMYVSTYMHAYNS